MDKNFLVTKSNYFIMNSSYDLSLEEQKLILTLASMVQPNDEEFKPYIFKISEFMELLGVENQSKYTEIPKITKELMKKVFEIHEENKLIQTAWISGAIYEKGSGRVILKFNPDLKPYMLQLKEQFTQYQLANILTMKSKYSPRIYEILKCNEFRKQGYIEIELEELKKLLRTEGMYRQYQDFKRKVIMQAQKEIKKLTDISFEFEEIKTGRKVTSLKFYIKANNSKTANKPLMLPTADNEISATVTELEEAPLEKISEDMAFGFKNVQSIMNEHTISDREALAILTSSNGDFNVIKKVYDNGKNKEIPNFIGWMISMVKPGAYIEPKKNYGKDSFNNYDQRIYDYSDLERKLLGWDKNETDDAGKNFNQGNMNV